MIEKRCETRQRRLKNGRIIYNDQCSVMSCTLRDISSHGARLRFGSPVYAPEVFFVSVPGEIEERPARRMWMTNTEIGVQFIGL